MKTNLTILLLLAVCISSFSQGIKIAPVIGPNVTFANMSKSLKDYYSSNFFEPLGGAVKTTIQPALRFQIGGLIDYSMNDAFSLQSGVLINLRGIKYKMKGEFTDDYGESMRFTGKGKLSITYLEIPVWATYKIGETGLKIVGGPSFGFATGGKDSWSAVAGDEIGSESEKIKIGNNIETDHVRPVDISLNLGISKEIFLGNNPLEVSLYVQPSISKWNPEDEIHKDYHIRHFTGGVRVAYFFSLKN